MFFDRSPPVGERWRAVQNPKVGGLTNRPKWVKTGVVGMRLNSADSKCDALRRATRELVDDDVQHAGFVDNEFDCEAYRIAFIAKPELCTSVVWLVEFSGALAAYGGDTIVWHYTLLFNCTHEHILHILHLKSQWK